MKRIVLSLLCVSIVWTASAQVQIMTRKAKINDFTQKIMKVVLPGNPMDDAALEQEISSGWRLSPYEFCKSGDFDEFKGNSDFYFMLLTKNQFKKEDVPGIEFITIVKGGDGASEGIGSMLEVCAFPLRSASGSDGREFEYLPAIMDMIQDYIEDSMARDVDAYAGFVKYASEINKMRGKKLVLADTDVSGEVNDGLRAQAVGAGIQFLDEDDAADIMSAPVPGTLVSYSVCPDNPRKGSYCFKMIFGSDDHRLYYFRKQSVPSNGDHGFTSLEIKKFISILK
ncbi:MAG: hypothetical protein ACI39U_07210 [Candidatus Cryptobacteroides sp.]